MFDVSNCNRIIVETNEKMDKIIDWYKQNEKWLSETEFHLPIQSALIEFKEELMSIAYEPDGRKIRIYVFPDGIYAFNFSYDPITKEIGERIWKPSIPKEKRHLLSVIESTDRTAWKSAFKFHALMCYAANFREYIEVSDKKEKWLTGKQKARIKRTGGTIPLISTFRIDNRDIPNISGKRQYTKPTEQVSVRGFWRTLKSGKRVWVRPFTKYNDKSGGSGKTYKL